MAKNSERSNVHPSKHSSVFKWLTLTEPFVTNKCHWGSTYLRNTRGRKWCQYVAQLRGSGQKWLPPAAVQSIPQRVQWDECFHQLCLVNLKQTIVFIQLNQSNGCSAGAKGYLVVRQAVVGWQAAVVERYTWDKVVQQVLARHQQTGKTDQSYMQPLELAETSRLIMAMGWNEKRVTHLHQRGFQLKTYHSPPPGDRWSPCLDLLAFLFKYDFAKIFK